jgi:FMN reductase
MNKITLLSGSPTKQSRSDKALQYLGFLLEQKGFEINHISVRDLPAEAVFYAQFDHPEITKIALTLEQSSGLLVGSPVYKGAYSGVLKAVLDLMPQDILQHKPVLPLMTGGSPSHLLALEYTLKPVLATLKGHNLKGIYLLDDQVDKTSDDPLVDPDARERAIKQLEYFIQIIKRQQGDRETFTI